jgi:hypothetical protein
MTNADAILMLEALLERYHCDFGDPGSNPDYFDAKEEAAVRGSVLSN